MKREGAQENVQRPRAARASVGLGSKAAIGRMRVIVDLGQAKCRDRAGSAARGCRLRARRAPRRDIESIVVMSRVLRQCADRCEPVRSIQLADAVQAITEASDFGSWIPAGAQVMEILWKCAAQVDLSKGFGDLLRGAAAAVRRLLARHRGWNRPSRMALSAAQNGGRIGRTIDDRGRTQAGRTGGRRY